MLFKGLRIAGFKSFVDPVEAPILPGLTGIVGPNGCGKSNVLEAVRWAMGAASAKALRADDMDSVIFSGSAQRPAREWAEVTLVLETANGDTLDVTRKIRREMGSAYRINGREARAKDVQLLFADASTGANSPALVRQGQVSELIAAKPENRRRVLEEAAGVTGLHARRHEADLKLAGASANLLRLDEITAEIEAQANHLRRQARLAVRQRELALEMRRVEALAHLRRIEAVREAASQNTLALEAAQSALADATLEETAAERAATQTQDALPPLRDEEMIAQAIVRKAEADAAVVQRDIAQAQTDIARLTTSVARVRADVERETARANDARVALAHLAEERARLRAEAETDTHDAVAQNAQDAAAKAKAADAAFAAASQAFLAASAAHEATQRQLSALQERVQTLAQRRKNHTAALEALQAQAPDLTAAASAVTAAENQLTQCDADVATLEADRAALEEDHDAKARAARTAEAALRALRADIAILEGQLADGENTILDQLVVAPDWEHAAASAFMDDPGSDWVAQPDRKPPRWPDGVQPLSLHVRAPRELAVRLAFSGFMEDARDAASLIAALAPGAQVVTRAGALWRWDGLHRPAGAQDSAALRMARRTSHAQLQGQLPSLQAQAQASEEESKIATQRLQAWRDADTTARARQRAARQHTAAMVQALSHARAQSRAHEEALRRAQADHDATEVAFTETHSQIAQVRTAAQTNPAPDPAAMEAARADADQARALAAAAGAQAELHARSKAQRNSRLAAIDADCAAWTNRRDAAALRIDALEAELASASAALAQASAKPDTMREALQSSMQAIEAAQVRAKAARDALAGAEKRARDASSALREAQQRTAIAREARAQAQAYVQAGAARMADCLQALHDSLGVEPDHLPQMVGPLMETALARAPLSEIERRFEKLRSDRDSAGAVNLRADEELQEVEQRLMNLARERADVAAAVAKLKTAISRLNSEARAKLMHAFEAINAHFAALFAILFEGGEARLALTDAEYPLACGLEIFATPPGKRLTTLSLMSGGEQALTATALIFAVFLANPAPLCVLDEVDAPLDDANVERYCRMLERMREQTSTRFFVITHNPITMARMDRLFGVTMPDAGASQIVSVDLNAAKVLAA